VLTEIVILNLVLTVAMLAMPLDVLGGGNPEQAYTLHRDDMLRAIAEYYVGPAFAAGSAIVFALLLLSAANTAITDLVSIQFMMSRDRELPAPMGLLNAWGMPLIPLALATAVPAIVLIAVSDVEKLADLYAIGVVGAVAINLGTCSTNPQVELSRFKRFGMGGLAILMIAIWITVAYEKPHALIFALSVMGAGLAVRYVVRNRAQVREWAVAEFGLQNKIPAEAPAGKIEWTPAVPPKHIVVATPGRSPVFRFALAEAKSRNAELHVLFVRHLAVPVLGTPNTPDVDVDPKARRFFELVSKEAEAAGVTVHCSYVLARNIAKAVVDFAVSRSADALILPTPQRGRVWRAMKGDVPRNVARRLPKNIRLLMHA
jgi:nucleotide-binding universal stress UspA family protein